MTLAAREQNAPSGAVENTLAPILFVAEAVTLAHVARPTALARGLVAQGRRVVMALDDRYRKVCPGEGWPVEPIASLPTERFLEALRTGAPIHDRASFDVAIDDDLALLARVRPALVVGDFRLSLGVSARLAGIPYVNLSNAYWSPYARPKWHVPALPWTRFVPGAIADRLFRAVRPIAFRVHASAMEAARSARGVRGLGRDLLAHYTDGDVTLYADPPELVPLVDAPPTHRHLGPVAWSPPLPLPAWWDALDRRRGVIYVTLGSSGSAARLPAVLAGLAKLGLPVVVATAGAPCPAALPANVHVAPYLPGDVVASQSRLVVCNGGSPTSQQALLQGVPVLALPSNLDQVLNSRYLCDAGVARSLRVEATS
ncbi:MAG: glycosyl transferase family 1, partial [Rhizobacter sp.]|nr:glycosyl transferase family 1 [Rhizobacter sp.]